MPVEQVNRAAVTVRHTKVINRRTFLVSLIVHPNNLGVEIANKVISKNKALVWLYLHSWTWFDVIIIFSVKF